MRPGAGEDKIMANLTFDIGDKVVYPGQGVAEIIAISEKDVGGFKLKFYELRLLETDVKIMVPVRKAQQVGLRNLISTEELDSLLTLLRKRDIVFDKQAWNRRYRTFVEKVKSPNASDVAEVFRDLSILKHQKELSFGEKRMLEQAQNLLVQEIALVRDIPKEEATALLDDQFEDLGPLPE